LLRLFQESFPGVCLAHAPLTSDAKDLWGVGFKETEYLLSQERKGGRFLSASGSGRVGGHARIREEVERLASNSFPVCMIEAREIPWSYGVLDRIERL
jgi:hypothetical protein